MVKLANGVCVSCGNPLKIIKGGQKTILNSTDIVMVHVFGCLNKECSEAMKEQGRQETPVPSFNG